MTPLKFLAKLLTLPFRAVVIVFVFVVITLDKAYERVKGWIKRARK